MIKALAQDQAMEHKAMEHKAMEHDKSTGI